MAPNVSCFLASGVRPCGVILLDGRLSLGHRVPHSLVQAGCTFEALFTVGPLSCALVLMAGVMTALKGLGPGSALGIVAGSPKIHVFSRRHLRAFSI